MSSTHLAWETSCSTNWRLNQAVPRRALDVDQRTLFSLSAYDRGQDNPNTDKATWRDLPPSLPPNSMRTQHGTPRGRNTYGNKCQQYTMRRRICLMVAESAIPDPFRALHDLAHSTSPQTRNLYASFPAVCEVTSVIVPQRPLLVPTIAGVFVSSAQE